MLIRYHERSKFFTAGSLCDCDYFLRKDEIAQHAKESLGLVLTAIKALKLPASVLLDWAIELEEKRMIAFDNKDGTFDTAGCGCCSYPVAKEELPNNIEHNIELAIKAHRSLGRTTEQFKDLVEKLLAQF